MSKAPKPQASESAFEQSKSDVSTNLADELVKELSCEEAIQMNVECVNSGKTRSKECRHNFHKLTRCMEAFAP